MRNFARDLSTIVEGFGLTTAVGPQHVYTYILPSDHVESVNICLQALQALSVSLEEKQEDLYGYSMFVSVCENTNNIEMGSWRYLVHKDNCMWLVSSLREMFGNRVDTVKSNGLEQIKKINLQKGLRPSVKDYIYDNHGVKEVLSAIIGRGVGQVLHVISPLGYGGYEIILKAFTSANKKGVAPLPLIYLSSQGSYMDDYLPFRRLLSPLALKAVRDVYANSQDFMTLRLLKWLDVFSQDIVQIHSDGEKEDFLSFFRLYLPVYRRMMMGNLPVMIIENSKKFGSNGAELLKLIVDVALKENLVIIHLSEKHEGGLCQSDEPVVVMDNKSAHDFISKEESLAIPANRLHNLNPMATLLFYWNYMTNGHNYFGEFSLTPVLYWLIKGFDQLSCRVIYLISVSDGMVPYEWILDATVEEKYWRALTVQRCKIFSELGLVRDLDSRPWLVVKAFGDMLASALGEEKEDLEMNLAYTILQKENYKNTINHVYLFKLLERLGLVDEAVVVLQQLLTERLFWRSEDLVNWLNYQYFRQIDLSPIASMRVQNLLETYDFAYRVRRVDTDGVQDLEERMNDIVQFNPRNVEPARIWLLLYCQNYYTGIGKPNQMTPEMKEVISLFQRWEDKSGECRSILEMAYIEFFNKRFRMAFDYCRLGSQTSEQYNYPDLVVLAIKLSALQHFLHGSMHEAANLVTEGIEQSIAHGYRQKEAFFRFLHVRICFEYGNYQDALAQLKKIERLSYAYGFDWTNDVVMAWKGRCYSHMHQADEAINILKGLSGCEAQYYLAEAYFISGQVKNAMAPAQKAMQYLPLVHQVIPQLDTEDWFSGYSLVEGYVEKGYLGFYMLERLTQGFFYYILGLNGDKDVAFPLLESLCEMEKLDTDDMYAYLYLYYYAQMCDEPGRSRMAHNRAVRLFTSRCNRCAELQSRKMLENGYFAQKILNNKPVNKFL